MELKPCPFCGREARIYMNDSDLDNIMWYCMCTNDNGCNVLPITLDHYSEEEAAEAWNTRADYHGFEQAAIDAWENIKAWNTRHVETCKNKATSLRTFWCDCCDCALEDWMDVGGKLVNGLRYCPNCGRMVEG